MPPRQLALFRSIARAVSDDQLRRVLGARLPLAIDVVGEIGDHRYGVLAETDRIMRFVDTDHVRHALDVEDLIAVLLAYDIVAVPPGIEPITAIHGALPRQIYPLAITARGGLALRRWTYER